MSFRTVRSVALYDPELQLIFPPEDYIPTTLYWNIAKLELFSILSIEYDQATRYYLVVFEVGLCTQQAFDINSSTKA